MARQYKITTPDGEAMTVEGPEDATDDELISFAQDQLRQRGSKYVGRQTVVAKPVAAPTIAPTPVENALSPGAQRLYDAQERIGAPSGIGTLINQGALYGLSDEIAGIGNALVNVVKSPFTGEFDPKQAYYDARDAERKRADDALSASPIAGTLATILGGFVGMNPAGAVRAVPNALSAIKSGAKVGVLGGALAGFGGGRDTETSITGSILGGGLGGALGGVVPVAGSVATNLRAGASRLLGKSQDELAREIVGKAIAADANTGASAGAMMDEARNLGVPFMLADTGENARTLAASVSRQPGPSRTIVRNAVTERQQQQGDRVRGFIERDLGPVANTYEVSDQLQAQARQAAAPIYERAYAAPVVSTPELDAILTTPAGRQALSRARTIAANERRDPSEMGFALDENGDVVLNPVRLDLFQKQAEAKSAFDAAQEAHRLALRTAGSDTDASREALLQARAGLTDATSALDGRLAEGTAATQNGYTTQTLDYVKRGLDDLLEPSRNPLTGKLVLDEAGRAINDVRASLVNEVDRLNPAYAEARSAYAGPASARSALEEGRDALRWSDEELARKVGSLSDPDREQFALGYRSALAKSLEGRVDDADKARAVLGTPAKRAALQTLFGGDEGLARFEASLGLERSGNDTFRAVATGSPTAERLAADAQTMDPGLQETAFNVAVRGAQGGGISGMALSLLSEAVEAGKFGRGEAGQRVRQSIASLLSESDPAALRQAVQEANAAVQAAEARRIGAYSRSIDTTAGLIPGLTVTGSNIGR